jgi:hypothetical protein
MTSQKILEKLFVPNKRYYGGKITFVKDQDGKESAQIVHDEIAVQVLALSTDFVKPRRPNLKSIMNQGIKLSFVVEMAQRSEGLIAKSVEFELESESEL